MIDDRAPDKFEPEIAFRFWNLRERSTNLHSLNQTGEWMPRQEMYAVCNQQPHECPDKDCQCGIYASTSWQVLQGYQISHIFGRVKMWGLIIPGQNGYRGEIVYPDELYLFDTIHPDHKLQKKWREKLEDDWQVPVILGKRSEMRDWAHPMLMDEAQKEAEGYVAKRPNSLD